MIFLFEGIIFQVPSQFRGSWVSSLNWIRSPTARRVLASTPQLAQLAVMPSQSWYEMMSNHIKLAKHSSDSSTHITCISSCIWKMTELCHTGIWIRTQDPSCRCASNWAFKVGIKSAWPLASKEVTPDDIRISSHLLGEPQVIPLDGFLVECWLCWLICYIVERCQWGTVATSSTAVSSWS